MGLDDPIVDATPADELGIRTTFPNEIDLLDVVDVDPMRPIFFDQRLLVTMVEDVNTKALLFRRDRSAARANFEAPSIAFDVLQNNFFASHD